MTRSVRFRLRSWTGAVWRVDVIGRPRGWHGFDLEPDGDGCRVTHTLELASLGDHSRAVSGLSSPA